MAMEELSLSDIAAVTKGDNAFGGSGAWVLIILFALIFGNGGFFGNNTDRAATAGDVQRAVDNATIQQDIQRTAYENMAVTKDASYNNLSEIRDVQAMMSSGFAAQQTCCCETLRAIDGVKYEGAMNTASINANTTASMQKILDKISADREADMLQRINQLETQNMFCGIPRINPYGYGVYPYANSCGCSGNLA